ncbi:MAG TPA: twin-arginine translocation signal domain-containing protein, partial [Phycisphaerae bacterium]|nr:twin-arginine translocation signal domain-containing protein [Phycisphaerae bacterium]
MAERINRRNFLKTTAAVAGGAAGLGLPRRPIVLGEESPENVRTTSRKGKAMKLGFHTDAFNSAYFSFEKCLAWAKANAVRYIECGLIDGVS